ncbi:MAG: PAS domain S-box protein [Candidatus Riflebacteria bacterium]
MMQLRNAIAEKVGFLSRILDVTHDVIWIMDISGNFLFVSPSVEKLRGFSVEEVIAQPAFSAIHDDDRRLVERVFATGVELIEKGVTRIPPGKVRLRQLCKNGSYVWTEVIADYVFNDSREFLFVLGFSRNIQEQVACEEKLKKLETGV